MVGWAGYVARVNETRNTYRNLAGKLKGKGPFGCPVNSIGIILKWNASVRIGLIWLKGDVSGGFLRTRSLIDCLRKH